VLPVVVRAAVRKGGVGAAAVQRLGGLERSDARIDRVTNTTLVNTETMCELLREVAARGLGLAGPITLVLDNARYQRNAVVQALATQLGITLLYLPSYSPNLNLIERLWKFIKRKELYGKYHARFDDFRTAIQTCLSQVSTAHRNPLKSLMTLNFQTFENVSLLSA
jgi:transposase